MSIRYFIWSPVLGFQTVRASKRCYNLEEYSMKCLYISCVVEFCGGVGIIYRLKTED
jgi:hypothetical protein